MQKRKKLNKTEESIFILLSLCVLSQQAYEAITGKQLDAHLSHNDADENFKATCEETIYEALVYQILLKACSYLDEWNKVFGIQTEDNDRDEIIKIKQLAKPAYKCISTWKHLREFRNEAIAHNHRDKNGENIYLSKKPFNSPQTTSEIYLLIFCLNRMTRCIDLFYPEVITKVLTKMKRKGRWRDFKRMSKKAIKEKMKQIDNGIADTWMRDKLISAYKDGVSKRNDRHLYKEEA